MKQVTFRAMGCHIAAALDAADAGTHAALAAVPLWFAAWEQALSRFRPDSELARLNRRAGVGWAGVSPTLWAALLTALDAARASDGLVTPTVLDALERAGYDRDFAALGRAAQEQGHGVPALTVPPAAPRRHFAALLRETASACGGETRAHGGPVPAWRLIAVDLERQRVALPRGVRLDLAGTAKGWAAQAAAELLAANGPALVDAGGDIALSGPRADGSPWPVAVADPRRPDAELDLLLLRGGGVATSGRDFRRWRQGARVRHHLIDQRTGEPANSDLLAVTVVAPDLQEAEVAAKVVFLLGREAGLGWLAERQHLAALLVPERGAVVRTHTLEPYRWRG